jgi:hypothetical protein
VSGAAKGSLWRGGIRFHHIGTLAPLRVTSYSIALFLIISCEEQNDRAGIAMQDLERYIVAPRSRSNRDEILKFLSLVAERSDVSIERIVGDQSNPRRVIIRGIPQAISRLQSEFSDHLIIEPDSGLKLLS